MSIGEVMRGPDGPIDLLQILEPEAYANVQHAVGSGLLPADTFIRLDSLGDGTPDYSSTVQASLRWSLLMDLDAFTKVPEHLPPRTRNIIWHAPPRALLTWDPEADAEKLHTMYDKPFLVRGDLVQVIKERRVQEGKTVTEVPRDQRWRPPEEVEHGQCMRISHALWGTMARHIMPEWLRPDALDIFYRPHKTGSVIGLEGSRQIMNRRIVGAIALNVEHIKSIYDQAISKEVGGIGPVGKDDLRTLLADEYPELY